MRARVSGIFVYPAIVAACLCACCANLRAAEERRPVPGATAAPPLAQFDLVRGVEPACIVLAKTEHKGVLAAAKDLQRDVTKITGVTPNIVHSLGDCAGRCVVLGTADCPEGKALLASVGVAVDDLASRWECFKYRVLNKAAGKEQVLAIAGSNVRGTIYGVYDFEQKHLGVDPLWFWADHEPPTRGELRFDERINFGPGKEPTWKYRGWTLNDHPIFMEWMESGLVQRTRYSRYMFAIHHDVLQRLMEAALRLKMNMFTWYFIDVDWQPDRERLQAVVDRGLLVTQQQMESVGADTGFWDTYWENHNPAGKPKVFSYRLHPEAFREFWAFYIKRWAEFSPQVVWEINLRGWADGPYTEPTLPDDGTPQQRAEIISQALADQARLVRQLDPNPDLEMMTTLYAELGRAYDQGWIKIPAGVTTGFSDAGMSGMSYSKKFWTEPRDPKRKYGQYFHTQYFGGGPQIAKCTPVEQYLKVNMDAMFQRGDTQHMLLAMNHLRHQQIEIRGIAEMLWSYPPFRPREYLLRYCRDEFGEAMAGRVAALYDEYYEKYPHVTRDDGFKKIPMYYKVMEPLFMVNGNLQDIDTGTRDGFVLNYQYRQQVYEQGIRDLGEVLQKALALRPSIPAERRYFFDYEFIDAIRQIRGIYRIAIATNQAIARLKAGDRAGALAALLDARPLVEDAYAAFRHNCATEKWQYWYRSGTNQEMDLMYNLYQKARLRLEVDALSFVSEIEPQRRPYLGNVVTHDPAGVGAAVYSNQPERHNGTIYNGAPYSIVSLPLAGVFQIGGIQSCQSKWKEPKPDFGLPYRFTLKGKATVYVARPPGQALGWLAPDGFTATGQRLEVGQWTWPYRYRNRPPTRIHSFDLFAKQFPAGTVTLGKNPSHGLPYIVFIKPSLLLYENFHGQAAGPAPAGWRVAAKGGRVAVVDNPDYEGLMRPSVFDLATVPRYRPLGLKSLELRTTAEAAAAASAEMPLRRATAGDFVIDLRLKLEPADATSEFSILDSRGRTALTVRFGPSGQISCVGPSGGEVAVARYTPRAWHSLSLEVSPARRRYRLTVQDDKINVTTRDGLELLADAQAPLAAVRLVQGAGKKEAWTWCDAIDAYER
jgi:hypothetical protein